MIEINKCKDYGYSFKHTTMQQELECSEDEVNEQKLVCNESDESSDGSSITGEASPVKIPRCTSAIDTFELYVDD